MPKIEIKEEVKKEFEKYNLNTKLITSKITYTNNKSLVNNKNIFLLDPYKIKNDCIEDLLKLCDNLAEKQKEKGKIEFFRIFYNKEKFRIYDYLEVFYKNARRDIIDNLAQRKVSVYEEIYHDIDGLRLYENNDLRLKDFNLEELLLRDLSDFMIAKQQSGLIKEIPSHIFILSSYKPKNYSLNNTYEFQSTRNIKEIDRAVKSTGEYERWYDDYSKRWYDDYVGGSCIMGSTFEFEEFKKDTGTLFFMAKENGKLKGYKREFLMEANTDESCLDKFPVLGVDVLEVPRKDFKNYNELIQAMGLASVHLGLDLNVKYVIIKDARIKFGLKQSFGNKKKKFTLKKIGDRVWYNSFDTDFDDFNEKQDVHILMQNWKI